MLALMWNWQKRLAEIDLIDTSEFEDVDTDKYPPLGEAPDDVKRILSLLTELSEAPNDAEQQGPQTGEPSTIDDLDFKRRAIEIDILEKLYKYTLFLSFPEAFRDGHDAYVGPNWIVYALPTDDGNGISTSGTQSVSGRTVTLQ